MPKNFTRFTIPTGWNGTPPLQPSYSSGQNPNSKIGDLSYEVVTNGKEYTLHSMQEIYVNTLHMSSGGTTTSDRRLKKEITSLDGCAEFLDKLRPVQYKYVDNTSNRMHWGFLAQDVRAAVGSDEYGVWGILSGKDDPNGIQHIRTDELVAPLVQNTQVLNAKVLALQHEIASLKATVDKLVRLLVPPVPVLKRSSNKRKIDALAKAEIEFE